MAFQPGLSPSPFSQPQFINQSNQGAPPSPTEDSAPIFIPPENEHQEIVGICMSLKTVWKTHATEKKSQMQRAYAYAHSKFPGGSWELLPKPSSIGSDRDASQDRPQIFMPVSREQYKLLYSGLKLILFPDNEDFMRVRAKTSQGVQIEDDLTEGVKYVFKQNQIVRQLGKFLQHLVIFGFAVAHPTFNIDRTFQWDVDPVRQEFRPNVKEGNPYLDLEIWNPLHFYVDPIAKNEKDAKWGYFGEKKLSQILDCPHYFNKDKASLAGIKTPQETDPLEPNSLRQFEGLDTVIIDNDKTLYLDHYYFPYLKLDQAGTEYRNIIVTIGADAVLLECRPNMMPGTPAVYGTWSDDTESPYGLGPMEEGADIQRLLNIVTNYMIEEMARGGNIWAISENVDMSNFYGAAMAIAVCQNPAQDMVNLSSNTNIWKELQNYIGTLKAEYQILSGAQNPFQGSSNIDFKKTATEISALESNSISIMREVVEHVSLSIEKILQKCLFILGEIHKEPIEVRVDDPIKGTRFIPIDFSVFRSGQFAIELIGANPSQSKAAQAQILMQLAQAAMQNPHGLLIAEPAIREVGVLNGVKNTQDILNQIKDNLNATQPQQPGVPGAQGGVGTPQQSGVGGLPPTTPGSPQ